jgi:O-antigen ligase
VSLRRGRSPARWPQERVQERVTVTRLGYFRTENSQATAAGGNDTLLRGILLAAVFLVLWISLHPFVSLGDPDELTETGSFANQIAYSLLLVLLAAWCFTHDPSRLLVLLRPVFVAMLFWFVLSVATSWEPALSARRLIFTLISMSIAAMVLLLPTNQRHFAGVMAAVVLIVLAACYLGVLLAPALTVHQTSDLAEPELAGDWRGVFSHKNEASVAMVLFIFFGMFVARVRSLVLGGLIVVSALVFLLFTQSKTAIAMLPITLIVTALINRIRSPAIGVAFGLLVVGAFIVLSIGSLFSEQVRDLLDLILPDASFTGRTDIWQFALDHIAQRPITGYGFGAFWGTHEVVYGMSGNSVWANAVAHAHNAYLNLALTIGIPGSLLVTAWLVVLPLVDFYRGPADPAALPLKLLFLRTCVYAACASCFESLLLQEGGLFLFTAAFGLRFLSLARIKP